MYKRQLLYYSRNPELLHPEITEDLLGCSLPLPARDQKTTFNSVVEETFGESCGFEVARTIHENLNQLLEEKKEDPEPLELDKADVRRLLADCGAAEEQLQHFEEEYEAQTGGHEGFMAANLASTRKFEIKTPDVTVNVSPERTDLVETRILDGIECLVIPLTDEVEVNGIRIRPSRIEEKSEEAVTKG